jgi:eukaryotic-like serine/threonine-protein kinase
MNGKTLGHYRVSEQLGRGGMGEVYVADDLNLNRKVALKFLPDAFAGDPERMARFEREAMLLASLNHPNIAAIYGLEQAEGKRWRKGSAKERRPYGHRC